MAQLSDILIPMGILNIFICSKITAMLPDLVVELHWEGSATNGATPSRYYVVGGNTNAYPSRHFGLSEFYRE